MYNIKISLFQLHKIIVSDEALKLKVVVAIDFPMSIR